MTMKRIMNELSDPMKQYRTGKDMPNTMKDFREASVPDRFLRTIAAWTCTAVMMLMFISAAYSQNGGTLSSRLGIGELNMQTTSRQQGMGGVSIPLLSSYDINNNNPAAWTEISSVRLEGSLLLENLTTDLPGGTYTSRTGGIQGLQFALPFDKDLGLTFVTGFLPLSRSEFKVETRDAEAGEAYRLDYESQGGTSVFRIGFSYRPISSIHLGAAYNYNFGTLSQVWDITFDNGTYYGTKQSRAASHNGSTFSFGAIYSGVNNLTVGAMVTTGTEIRSSTSYDFSYSTNDSTVTGVAGTITLPMVFGFGASYLLNDHLLIAMDYSAQDWTNAKSYDQPQTELSLSQKIGGGIEFAPSKETGASFIERSDFRLGSFYRTSYIKLQEQSINELAFTAGMGFPIGTHTRGDIAFEYGMRGKSSDMFGKESILRLSLSISASELWFTRRGDD